MNDYLDFDGLVVYTGGTFDLFHAGHVNFLKRCKEIAGELGSVVVSLNTDEFIKEYKGKPPVVSFSDRMAVPELFPAGDRRIHRLYPLPRP